MVNQLAELAEIGLRKNPGVEDVLAACELVRERLSAKDCYVIRLGDPPYRLGCDLRPEQYEIEEGGYWALRDALGALPEEPALIATISGRRIVESAPLREAVAGTHAVSTLVGDESSFEILVAVGDWTTGLDQKQVDFLLATRPAISSLITAVVDQQRQLRQRAQLDAISEVATAFTRATDPSGVLNSIATAAAKAAGIDYAAVTVYSDDVGGKDEIGRNTSRISWRRESLHEVAGGRTPVEADEASEAVRELLRAGQAILRPDVYAQKLGLSQELIQYYQIIHVASAAIFPLIFQGNLVGSIRFSSSTRIHFGPDQVEFLVALSSQVASSVMGLRLLHKLEQSREELKEYAARLEEASQAEHFLARTDALTGIPNRRFAEEVMRAERARMERYGHPVSVVIVDIDHFKGINDNFGHQAGDEVLKQFAVRARELCRLNDFVARWGGDEFVVILPMTDHREAEAFAERFRAAVEAMEFSVRAASMPLKITISAGVAQAENSPADTADHLFDRADKALYEAKDRGRNSVVCARIRSAAA